MARPPFPTYYPPSELPQVNFDLQPYEGRIPFDWIKNRGVSLRGLLLLV